MNIWKRIYSADKSYTVIDKVVKFNFEFYFTKGVTIIQPIGADVPGITARFSDAEEVFLVSASSREHNLKSCFVLHLQAFNRYLKLLNKSIRINITPFRRIISLSTSLE